MASVAATVDVDEMPATCLPLTNTSHLRIGKAIVALAYMRVAPARWFGNSTIEPRDSNLLSAPPVPWLLYDKTSFVRKIVCFVTAIQTGAPADPLISVSLQDGSGFRERMFLTPAADSIPNVQQTDWTVETDFECKNMIASAGAQVEGFTFASSHPTPWLSMKGERLVRFRSICFANKVSQCQR